ncbi:MAG TPA: hypothetical protein VK700_01120 [Steroidobacteraceae bacterium]|jgi:hypothetical protein|nr:hypothetical protein [Steroidobacteraceae bacterium]
MSAKTTVAVTTVLSVTLGASIAYAQSGASARIHEFAALPDWTGLWETEISVAVLNGEFDKAVAAPSADAALPSTAGAAPAELGFLNRMQLLGRPPYNPEWQRKSQGVATHVGVAGAPPPLKVCGKAGFPTVMESPVPDMEFQAFVTPEETLFLFPDGTARHIRTDGRPHPGPEDLWPTDLGDSIGHWEGATLVIDTIARKAGPIAPFFMPGIAILSEQAHFTERVTRIDANSMQDEMTIDDPKRFVHPWKVTIRYKQVSGIDRMLPTDCTENDRNPIVNGKVTLAPP